MAKNDEVKLGRFISLVLRHKPETIGLTLDHEGWAKVDELIEKMCAHGAIIDLTTLQSIVANNDKQRYNFDAQGTRIRANQGHSISVDLKLSPQKPPALLYHGTALRFLESIRSQGICKMKRQYVHLSADIPTATKVGIRHGKVVVLTINAQAMYEDGINFYLSENKVWLCDHVSTKYINWDAMNN